MLTFIVVCGNGIAAWSQEANPSRAPTPAAPTTPTLQVGPSPIDAATQPGFSEATDQNLLAPPRTNNRRPARTSPVSTSRNTSRYNSAFSPRLARAAPIMGDSFAPTLAFQDELGLAVNEFPQGGGATRSKIAENSSSLPMDRYIFNYNYFRNAIDDSPYSSSSVDRFTLGFEKTFLDQMMSVEVRMPFVADNDFVSTDFVRNGSDVGNLSVTLKGVLTSNADSLLAAGLTIDTPTGGGSVLTINNVVDQLIVDVSNDAVHLSPFLGFLYAPRGINTHQGFLQIDVPTNANAMQFRDVSGVATTELLEQTLLYVDYSFSRQLYHAGRGAQSSHGIRRILGLAELHYTTTLEDSDVVLSGTTSNPLFEVTSAGNRLDVVNITLGLHTELNNGTQLRLGTVAPITNDDDRFFDFEFQAQLNIPL
ncbi:MAG: hypothetical protein GXP24_11630 [Planctomycetes bacterium]|nr:hypothetical protein [Planctomycetota bacterium]